ncbi:MAG TPA: single-stranded-DNA-specific exonuclease RecJ, partial [bacterium]|nr:single-stranded-DNA-specific exonuclease RecJ [bacterium]
SIDSRAIEPFAERFDEECARRSAEAGPARLVVDALISPGEITEELASELSRLGPFGAGNPEPVLMLRGARVSGARIVGNGHLKLTARCGGLSFDAIGFGMADSLPAEGAEVSLAFLPEINTWQGVSSVQLKLSALKPSS